MLNAKLSDKFFSLYLKDGNNLVSFIGLPDRYYYYYYYYYYY